MNYQIRHRTLGIDVIDPSDNSATYVRYRDIPELVDQLQEAYAENRRHWEGVKAADIPDSAIESLLR